MGRPKGVRKSEPEAPKVPMKKTRGKRYSDHEKAIILDKAIAEMENGGQITKIAEKLGVTFFTLKAWLTEKGVLKSVDSPMVRRGRPSTKAAKPAAVAVRTKKAAVASRAVAAESPSAEVKPAYVRELEKKIEELMQKTKKLSHLYGELRSEVGIGD
jgi:hypothetical protein